MGLPGSLVLEKDAPQQMGCPSRGGPGSGLRHSHPTFSPAHLSVGFQLGWIHLWFGPFLPLLLRAVSSWGPSQPPLFSALTTWTNARLINHLCGAHLSCGLCCFSGGYCDPWKTMQTSDSAPKHFPHSDPSTLPHWGLLCRWTLMLSSSSRFTSMPSGGRRRRPQAALPLEKHSQDQVLRASEQTY